MREIFALVGSITMQGMDLVEKNFSKLDKTLNSIVKPIDKVGKSVENLGKKMTVLTAPIAAIGAGIVALSVKTGAFAESLLNLQQTTGISTDNLQRYKHVADTVGVSFDGLVGGASKLTARLQGIDKDGGNAYNALAKIGVSAKDSSGNLKKMNDLFPEVVSALQNVEDVTIRNSLANQIFGKDLKNIAPILGMTTKELDAMMKKADELGLVMDEKAIAAAAKFDDQVGLLKERVSAMGMQLATSFIPILQDTVVPLIEEKVVPAVQKFAAKIKEVIDWFKNLSPETQRLVVSVSAFVMVSGPALIAVGKMISSIKVFTGVILAAKSALLAFNGLMIANPFTVLTVGAIAAAAALLAVNKELDKFKDPVSTKEDQEYNKLLEERAKMSDILRAKIGDEVELYGVKGKLNKEVITYVKSEIAAMDEHIAAYEDGAEALAKYNAEHQKTEQGAKKTATKTKTILTDDQIAAAKDLAEKRMSFEKEWTDKNLELSGSRLDNFDRETEKQRELAKALGADLKNLEEARAIERKRLQREINKEIDDGYEKQAQKAQESADSALETQRKLAQGIREQVLGLVSAFQGFGNDIAGIFSGMNENRSIQIDNEYKKQKAAIEASTMDEKAKQDAIKKLDEDTDKRRTALKRKQALQDKVVSIFNVVLSTAEGVMKAWAAGPIIGPVMSAIIAGIGAAQAAVIAARPLPLEEGGLVKSRPKRGILAQIGEGVEDEIVIPMKTGAKVLARMVTDGVRDIIGPPAGLGFAMAGGGSAGGSQYKSENHWHIGVLVADDRGIKELERRQEKYRISEQQRKGL